VNEGNPKPAHSLKFPTSENTTGHARTSEAEDTLATITARLWDNVTRPSQRRRHGKQIPRKGVRFSLLCNVEMMSVIHTVSYPMGTGVKRPRIEADLSNAFAAQVKNEWRYTSTPPMTL